MSTLPKITEKQFMAQVIELASVLGWRVYHTHDSRHSAAGFPDLMLLRGTVMIVAELKVGTHMPTQAQREWIGAFVRLRWENCQVFVWRPTDWDEIEAALA